MGIVAPFPSTSFSFDMHSSAKTRVSFVEKKEVTVDDRTKSILTAPNHKVVQQLGLKNAPDARIGFEGKGTIIYAKTRADSQKVKILWEKVTGRWANRHRSAIVAFGSIRKIINARPGASRSAEVQEQLVKVWRQIEHTSSVRAEDLDMLFKTAADVEKSHVAAEKEKARAVERRKQIHVAVKNTAGLITANAAPFIKALHKGSTAPFTKKAVEDFQAFIKQSALDNKTSPDYELAHAFAAQWAEARPNEWVVEPLARNLIDSLVKLVMEGCDMKAPPTYERTLNKFIATDGELYRNGNLFLPNGLIGKGGFGSISIYGSVINAETIVVKNLKRANDNDMKIAAVSLKEEARVHAQATANNSNHIVDFLGMVEGPDGHPMLILEHAPNGDGAALQQNIDKSLENQTLTGDAASDVLMTAFADMVKGVEAAHDAGIMHLDIKPPNFFANKLGQYKLGDFGTSCTTLAKVMESPVEAPNHSAPELHEQGKENLITYNADIWSLGVMLFEATNDQNGNNLRRPLQQPFSSSSFRSEIEDNILQFTRKGVKERFEHLNLDERNEKHQLIIQMLDPNPSMRPSLATVRNHPSIAPYASPSTKNEKATERFAREWIIENSKKPLIEVNG